MKVLAVSRLYDSHRRVQRVNQNLEEKLLQMADKCTEDKSQLTRDVETLSVRLAESNCTIGHLHKENVSVANYNICIEPQFFYLFKMQFCLFLFSLLEMVKCYYNFNVAYLIFNYFYLIFNVAIFYNLILAPVHIL